MAPFRSERAERVVLDHFQRRQIAARREVGRAAVFRAEHAAVDRDVMGADVAGDENAAVGDVQVAGTAADVDRCRARIVEAKRVDGHGADVARAGGRVNVLAGGEAGVVAGQTRNGSGVRSIAGADAPRVAVHRDPAGQNRFLAAETAVIGVGGRRGDGSAGGQIDVEQAAPSASERAEVDGRRTARAADDVQRIVAAGAERCRRRTAYWPFPLCLARSASSRV